MAKTKAKKTIKKKDDTGFKFLEKQVNEYGSTCLFRNVKLAWVNLARPNTRFGDKDRDGNVYTGTYEITILFPENETFLMLLEKTFLAICQESKKLKNQQERTKVFKIAKNWFKEGCPLKLGENVLDKNGQPYNGFEDSYVIKAKTQAELDNAGNWKAKKPIKILYANKAPIPEDKIDQELYGGVIADAQVSFVAYVAGKNYGITCYLDGVMKIKDGDRLASAPDFFDDRSDEFDGFEDGEQIGI